VNGLTDPRTEGGGINLRRLSCEINDLDSGKTDEEDPDSSGRGSKMARSHAWGGVYDAGLTNAISVCLEGDRRSTRDEGV
jgi:hypothetical protein